MEELIPIFFFISVAAVLILRPLTKRLGILLEAVARSKMGGTPPTVEIAGGAELARMSTLLEHVARRIDHIEERLDFTERLVATTQRNGARLDGLHLEGVPRRQEADYLAR